MVHPKSQGKQDSPGMAGLPDLCPLAWDLPLLVLVSALRGPLCLLDSFL